MSCSILIVAALLAAEPKAAEGPKAPPSEPAAGEEPKFQKPETAELYRQALAEFRQGRYAEATKILKKGRSGLKARAEIDLFEGLLKEAQAGEALEKIRLIMAQKGGEPRAMAELQKALPKAKGLKMLKEYRRLEEELREILYSVIEDFELEEDGSSEEGGGAEDAKAEKKSRKTRRRGTLSSRYGDQGKAIETWVTGGEIVDAKSGADKVRQGERSYRWPVGKEQRVKILEFDPGPVKDHKNLLFWIRGTDGKGATVQVYLLHQKTEPLQFALGRYRGYSASVTVKGAAWKEVRLSIDKDFAPKDEPEKDRIAMVVFIVKSQEEQVLYLDDVRLER